MSKLMKALMAVEILGVPAAVFIFRHVDVNAIGLPPLFGIVAVAFFLAAPVFVLTDTMTYLREIELRVRTPAGGQRSDRN
jgi:hypothetical protein